MKHAWKKLLAAAVLPCLLAGCGALGGPESEVPSMDHLLGLTQEQRLEDYDYLVQTLGDSYLCMGVRDRDNPEDPSAAIFQAYREMIQESDSDEVFYSAVYSTHCSAWGRTATSGSWSRICTAPTVRPMRTAASRTGSTGGRC